MIHFWTWLDPNIFMAKQKRGQSSQPNKSNQTHLDQTCFYILCDELAD